MEIERKWMVAGWPEGLSECEVWNMDQGYISVKPTVRIRREELVGVKCDFILCFKGAPSEGGIQREEIETPIEEELYDKLKALIGLPLIKKERRVYKLSSGHMLEVNVVDPGTETEYSYAEVEFETLEDAKEWNPETDGLGEYLSDECTGRPGSSMGAYWSSSRLGAASDWKKNKMILFDLDGTLWDSAKEVADSWNIVIDKAKSEMDDKDFISKLPSKLTAADLKSVMGKTMEEIALTFMPEADSEKRKILFKECETFEVDYIMERGAVMYPKVQETLEKLISMGYKLAIVSNCQENYIKAFLVSMKMDKYFCDYEEWGRTQLEKSENIKLVIQRNQKVGEQMSAVYVGDTQKDCDAAVKAGVPFIWASYGFGSVDSADGIISSFEELPELLKNTKLFR